MSLRKCILKALQRTMKKEEGSKLSSHQAGEIYAGMLEALKVSLKETGVAKFPGLGTLKVVRLKERKVSHPRNKKIIVLPPRNKLKFSTSSNVKHDVSTWAYPAHLYRPYVVPYKDPQNENKDE
eukprot:TRINITY_DN4040_c0_g1_i1.p1 TRINITY_DN4040_c0_g1~~TRINITY_DN4040_c0_g1_i1.p1  ORF type:complete len:124 (-),score=12.18 TRINITY_DN4040_c0_g1_i1:56-427(-)